MLPRNKNSWNKLSVIVRALLFSLVCTCSRSSNRHDKAECSRCRSATICQNKQDGFTPQLNQVAINSSRKQDPFRQCWLHACHKSYKSDIILLQQTGAEDQKHKITNMQVLQTRWASVAVLQQGMSQAWHGCLTSLIHGTLSGEKTGRASVCKRKPLPFFDHTLYEYKMHLFSMYVIVTNNKPLE